MRIFLTGATGFLGRGLLERLLSRGTGEVRCLVRDPARLTAAAAVLPVRGSLEGDAPGSDAALRDALHGCDVVVHLAGRTGRAPAAEHDRVNARGTARLLAAAAEAGVPRFVHVSTIAVTYPEKANYPYARSKEEAERLVRASGLDWAILRPTIVCGPGSPLAPLLTKLADAPVLPLFGGGRARIQPVHVDDVAEALAALAMEATLGGRTVDFGGRDVVTFDAFLTALRVARKGRPGPRLPVPLAPLVAVLGALEPLLGGALPVTAGQFQAFRHDGIARDDAGAEPPRAARKGLDEIVAELRSRPASAAGGAPPDARLDAECNAFVRHLAGIDAPEHLRRHYRRAHEPGRHGPVDPAAPDDPLVAFARGGPGRTYLADAWASLFDRGGPLRRKLSLVCAMLESDAATSARVDGPTTSSPLAFVLGTAWRVAVFVPALPVAGILLAARGLRRRTGSAA
jgi:nucleoside-diphosphate-sugar epimerase